MKLVISADIGKFETEVMGRDFGNPQSNPEDIKLVRFRTKMYDLAEGYVELQGNSYVSEFEGTEYIVGEQGQSKSFDTSKTNILHKLSCYTAITQFLEPNTKDNDVYMVLACPTSVLQIQEAKEEYKQYIKGDGEIHIKVNGQDYYFTIQDIMIKAEGSGIIYLEPQIFQGKTVAIFDLGGLNEGFGKYIDMVCKKEDRFIEECGTDRLIEIVREQLSIYKKGNLIDASTAEKALLEGGILSCGRIDEESKKFVERAKEIYLKEALENAKKHKFNIDEYDTVCFVGGTTSHVKDLVKKQVPHSYIPEEPQISTVKGLYKVAYKKYKDVERKVV